MKLLILLLSLSLTSFLSFVLLHNTKEAEQEVIRLELSKLENNKHLPLYLASLYLGPVRGVMINTLWLRYDQARNERMYYESKEVIEILLLLQPHNSTIWQFLARELSMNIPALLPKSRKWEWEKNGLLKLFEGIGTLPDAIELKHQMMEILYKKSNPEPGILNNDFIDNFSNDSDLITFISPQKANSPFITAVYWAELCHDQIKQSGSESTVTDTGLILHASTFLNYIRDLYLVEGFRRWEKKEYEQAIAAFNRVKQTVERFIEEYERYTTQIHYNFLSASDDLILILKNEAQVSKPDYFAQRAFLQKYPTLEEQFMYPKVSRFLKDQHNDNYEFNDSESYSKLVSPNKVIKSILLDTLDKDIYMIHSEYVKHAKKLTLKIDKLNEGNFKIDLFYYDKNSQKIVINETNISEVKSEQIRLDLGEISQIFISIYPIGPITFPINYAFAFLLN